MKPSDKYKVLKNSNKESETDSESENNEDEVIYSMYECKHCKYQTWESITNCPLCKKKCCMYCKQGTLKELTNR